MAGNAMWYTELATEWPSNLSGGGSGCISDNMGVARRWLHKKVTQTTLMYVWHILTMKLLMRRYTHRSTHQHRNELIYDTHGRYTGDAWEIHGRCMGDTWELIYDTHMKFFEVQERLQKNGGIGREGKVILPQPHMRSEPASNQQPRCRLLG